jgi:hypothetical protein
MICIASGVCEGYDRNGPYVAAREFRYFSFHLKDQITEYDPVGCW